MSDNLLKQFTKINMLNIIVGAIVMVWMFATVKTLITDVPLTDSAKSSVDGLFQIMLLVLGYYLKSRKEIGDNETDEK